MLIGEKDVADEAVALPQHEDFLRRLKEVERLEEKQLTGHAAGPAEGLATNERFLLPLNRSSLVSCICLGAQGFRIGSCVFTMETCSSPSRNNVPFLIWL